MSRLRLRVTPALVISVVALIVALAGTSYAAGFIGTAQLKDKAVTNPKLAPLAVGLAKIKDGAVSQSKLGVSAPTASISVPANSRGSVTAGCPSGTVVMDGGGGFAGVTARYALLSVSNASGSGWLVEGWNLTATAQTLSARAICIKP